MKNTNKKRGFTLIELVVVVAVIAILAAVLIPTFTGVIDKANQSADEAAVRNINTAIAGQDIGDAQALKVALAAEGYNSDYTPLRKNNLFYWDTESNQVVLVSDGTVSFPKNIAGAAVKASWELLGAAKNFAKVESATQLGTAANKDSEVILSAGNLALTDSAPAIEVKKDLVVYLNGANITVANDTVGDGVFYVPNGGSLTLNGNGTVNGAGANDYDIAIWANGGDVVINGGYYTNLADGEEAVEGDTGANHYDLIYVKNGGKVTINGGSFKCKTTMWTLNINNVHGLPGSIVVNGGEFFEFDPSTMAEDSGVIVNCEFEAVEREDGTWYVAK